jgi:hypothetical protein
MVDAPSGLHDAASEWLAMERGDRYTAGEVDGRYLGAVAPLRGLDFAAARFPLNVSSVPLRAFLLRARGRGG